MCSRRPFYNIATKAAKNTSRTQLSSPATKIAQQVSKYADKESKLRLSGKPINSRTTKKSKKIAAPAAAISCDFQTYLILTIIMELSLLDKVKEIVSNYYQKDQQKVIDKQEIKITQMYSLANDVFQVSTPDHPDILVKIYHKALPEFTDSLLEIRIVKMLS